MRVDGTELEHRSLKQKWTTRAPVVFIEFRNTSNLTTSLEELRDGYTPRTAP